MGAMNTTLHDVMDSAEERINTKGAQRHRMGDEEFTSQPIFEISRRLKGNVVAAPLFQAVKKIYESGSLSKEQAENELLDAIVYISAAITLLKESEK